MAYVGNTPTQQAFTAAVDYFSGNASTTAFTLSRPVASVAQVQAVIENVPQNPGSAFTVSGSTITFTSAPPSGSNNIYVYYTSPITQVVAPSPLTVTQSTIASGVAGTGPAFSAYQNSAQTITTNTWTKVNIDTEEWDTASCFNNTGSTVGGIPAYAFKPNIAGYYVVDGCAGFTTSVTFIGVSIYKNGAGAAYSVAGRPASSVDDQGATRQFYLNGTTDYLELYVFATGTTPALTALNSVTYFQASLVRAA